MLQERYEFGISENVMVFEFDSIGPQGIIRKIVAYRDLVSPFLFNLGFGDKDVIAGAVSDLTVSDNKDAEMVLATVAATLYIFTDQHPGVTAFITGSRPVRTRLYQMDIGKYPEELLLDFVIEGLTENGWESFRKRRSYLAFSAVRNA